MFAGGELDLVRPGFCISPTRIKDHKVAASKDNPEFIVETDEGKRAAHKAGALRRLP